MSGPRRTQQGLPGASGLFPVPSAAMLSPHI